MHQWTRLCWWIIIPNLKDQQKNSTTVPLFKASCREKSAVSGPLRMFYKGMVRKRKEDTVCCQYLKVVSLTQERDITSLQHKHHCPGWLPEEWVWERRPGKRRFLLLLLSSVGDHWQAGETSEFGTTGLMAACDLTIINHPSFRHRMIDPAWVKPLLFRDVLRQNDHNNNNNNNSGDESWY